MGAPRVSRQHAQIERAGDQYIIQDRGSRNGTLLNDKPLAAKTVLANGDRINIGDVELTFYEDPSAARAEAVSVKLEDDEPDTSLLERVPVAPPPPPALAGSSVKQLRALVQMLKRLGGSLDIDATLRELLSGLFEIFPQAHSGFVAFTSPGPTPVSPRATHFRRPQRNARLALSRTLINHVLTSRDAVLWTRQGKAPGLPMLATLEDMEVRSVMCAPLLDTEGQAFGVVQLDSDDPRLAFMKDDLEVLVGAVSQAAIAVRYAKLHEDGLRRLAIERDLQLARQVQLGLLPAECPACEGYEFYTYYQTAYEVGGDYYDFIELPNGRLAIVLADVAGKGVSAALLMARVSGELKYHLSCSAPEVALMRVNESLCEFGLGRFVTLLLAILEKGSSRLTLLNAGHPAPLRRRGGGAVEAVGDDLRGIALGLLPGKEWTPLEVQVEPGDVWFAFTDGFTEAEAAGREMYGMERLKRGLAQAPARIQEAGEGILTDVRQFSGDHPQSDDMCLLGWGRPTVQTNSTTSPVEEVRRSTGLLP